MNEQKPEEEQQLSKYNQGLPQLFRLDNLWQQFHTNVLKGHLTQANWVLDRVWGELSADASKEAEEKYFKFRSDIEKCKTNLTQLYHLLMEKETFLRKLQNVQGKGTAYISEEETELD